jgi:hypothetical protein
VLDQLAEHVGGRRNGVYPIECAAGPATLSAAKQAFPGREKLDTLVDAKECLPHLRRARRA